MADFSRFAAEAVAGRKIFVLSHSAQVPEGYASTTETADVLIQTVRAKAVNGKVDWGDGWIQSRKVAKGRFLVLGFEGTDGQAHMRHLRGLAKIWRAAGDPFRRGDDR
jgi:hypothetical protein